METAPSITQNGRLEPFDLQVSRGQILGHSAFFRSFYTQALNSTTPYLVGPLPQAYVFPVSATTMTMSSSSAADIGDVVQVEGLDANYNTVIQTATLNGQTGVALATPLLRINQVTVLLGTVAGNIYVGSGTLTAGVPANIYGYVALGDNVSMQAVYTVPAGYTLYFTGRDISTWTANTNKQITVDFWGQNGGETYHRSRVITTIGNVNFYYNPPVQITEKMDVYYNANTTDTSSSASIQVTGVLIKNDGSL